MSANLYKSVKVGNREFVIKKFTAKTGLRLGRLILAKAMPIMDTKPGDANKKKSKEQIDKENKEFYTMIGTIVGDLSDEDMDMMIDETMKVCFEKFPDKEVPVMDKDGTYLIEDVQYNLALTLRLCVEAIIFGASDFFEENGLNLSQLLK